MVAERRRVDLALDELRRLPLSTRDYFSQRLTPQRRQEPFVRASRSRGTSGAPLLWYDTPTDLAQRSGVWRTLLQGAGVTAEDRLLHCLPPASATAQDCLSAALQIGAVSMVGNLAAVEDLHAFAATVLVASPPDALRLGRLGDLADGSVRLVIVSGEPGGSIASTRRRVEHGLGAGCLDVYALTESGVVGWGCTAAGGVHLLEDEFVVECIDPDSATPIPDGTIGELVVTTRDEQRTPLVRYRTGDLVQLSHVPCGCGNASVRAETGVLGRVAERLFVRGVELLPSTVEQVVLRHPAVADYRIVEYRVRGECQIGVQIEADDAIATEGDRARVAAEVSQDLRRSFGLRLECDVVPPGTLMSQADGRRARTLRRQ